MTKWAVGLVPVITGSGNNSLGFQVYNETAGNVIHYPQTGVYTFAIGDHIRFLVWPNSEIVPANSILSFTLTQAAGNPATPPFTLPTGEILQRVPVEPGPVNNHNTNVFWWPYCSASDGEGITQLQVMNSTGTTGSSPPTPLTFQFSASVTVTPTSGPATTYITDPEMTITDG